MAQIFVSAVAHFFVVVGGSKFHERVAHFFIDIYTRTLILPIWLQYAAKFYYARTNTGSLSDFKMTFYNSKVFYFMFVEKYQDFNLVVAQDNGRPYEEHIITQKLRTFIQQNDLKPVVFHSLRHSSTGMKLKISGGDIKAVQGDTGHAQANMVTDIYSHIIDSDRKHLARKSK